jgi:hypothetical protein
MWSLAFVQGDTRGQDLSRKVTAGSQSKCADNVQSGFGTKSARL